MSTAACSSPIRILEPGTEALVLFRNYCTVICNTCTSTSTSTSSTTTTSTTSTPSATTTTTSITSSRAIVSPAGCSDQGAGLARRGKAYKESPVKGGPACATLCAEDHMECAYYRVHRSRGCMLLKTATGKLIESKSFVAHGTCTVTTTVATKPPAGDLATCTQIKLDPAGKGEGGYNGPVVGNVPHKSSPDGKAWTFDECALACNSPDYAAAVGFKATIKVCGYFLLSEQRGCVLKTKKRAFVPNYSGSTVTDHADCGTPAPGATTTATRPLTRPATMAPVTTQPPTVSPATTPQDTETPSTKQPPATATPAISSGATAAATTPVAMPATCTAHPHSSNGYDGPIIAKYNDAHPGGHVGDPNQCAALCAPATSRARTTLSTRTTVKAAS